MNADFQSTHSRGVRRNVKTPAAGALLSIHALTWSATAHTFNPYAASLCKRFSADRFKYTIKWTVSHLENATNPYFIRGADLPGILCELPIRTSITYFHHLQP